MTANKKYELTNIKKLNNYIKDLKKYSREEREIIAKFLETEVLKFASKTNPCTPFSQGTWWVNIEDIKNVINELRIPIFKDIKNKIGVRFRAPELFGHYDEYIICGKDIDTEDSIVDFVVSKKGVIISLDKIPDDTLVEIVRVI